MRKGFYFSMDSVLALVLMSASMVLVLQITSSGTDFETSSQSYTSLDDLGQDAMRLASLEKVSSMEESYLESIEGKLENETVNSSIIDAASLLWARGNETEAKELLKEYFSSRIPKEYEYRISFIEGGQQYVIYNTTGLSGNESVVTASSTLVSGHKINETSSGHRARAVLNEVTKNATKTTYFGGFVGQGTIYSNVTLDNLEEVTEIDLEGDFSGEFDLFLNEEFAGHYEPEPGNLTAAKYDICSQSNNESLCSNLTEGSNLVKIDFTGENQSLGGGLLEIDFISDYSLSASEDGYNVRKKKLPGVDGIINLYTSFYVPGTLNSLSADMHYKLDNKTLFVKIGNSTVYENRTDGEVSVKISNSVIKEGLLDENISYSYLEQRNVPLRVGIRNLDRIYSRALADSVSVIDASGSMGNDNKLEKAKNASEEFVDILLNASGNRAGIVGFDDSVTESQGLTSDKGDLDSTIEALTAGGGTCPACGILEAKDFLEDEKSETLVSRGSVLQFNSTFAETPPIKDGLNWTELNYDSSGWNDSEAILGTGTPVSTEVNASDPVYFRKIFDYDPEFVSNLSVAVRTDYAASVWINGRLAFNESGDSDATYWNTISGNRKFKEIVGKYIDSFERSNLGENWTVISGTEGSDLYLGNDCGAQEGSEALVLTGGGPEVETGFSSGSVETVEISYWMKQGDSGSCERPDDSDGDDVYFEYLDSSGSWRQINKHEAGGDNPAPGQWQLFNFSIPKKQYHSDLKFRFRYPPAAGESYDYWAVDKFKVWKANTTKVPDINSSWINDGENVVAAKLRDNNKDVETIEIDSESEWGSGSFSNTEVKDGSLSLTPTLTSSSQDVDAGSYCAVEGGSTYYEHIESVEINGIDRTTGDNGGYIDATDSITEQLVPGENYSLSVTFGQSGSYSEYATAVFDWDGDGEIDDNSAVEIGTCSSDLCTVSEDITVPEDASKGSTLLRVMGEYDQYHYDPCSNPGYNEIEDYSAYIDEPSYSSGSYTSKTFGLGKKVNFTESEVKAKEPGETYYDVNFSVNGNSFSSIDNMPPTDSLKVNISLYSNGTLDTPEIDRLELVYNAKVAEFDLQVNATEKRKNSMIVMSDGEPSSGEDGGIEETGNCPASGVDSFSGADAATIEAAYRANQQSNTTVYTIGFGSDANEEMLNVTARCGGGEYYYSGLNELEEVFGNISDDILNASFVAQSVETENEEGLGRLYSDSSLKINYTEDRELEFDKIRVQLSSDRFGGNVSSPKNGSFEVPSGSEIVSARLSSYSGDRWTDRASIKVNGSFKNFYNLSRYKEDYQTIGDPFILHIPPKMLNNNLNNVRVDTALDPTLPKGGSPDNRFYYTVKVPGSVGYGEIFSNSSAAREDANDRLEELLTIEGDEPVVNLSSSDFEYASNVLGDESYLWGPANMRLVIWE